MTVYLLQQFEVPDHQALFVNSWLFSSQEKAVNKIAEIKGKPASEFYFLSGSNNEFAETEVEDCVFFTIKRMVIDGG